LLDGKHSPSFEVESKSLLPTLPPAPTSATRQHKLKPNLVLSGSLDTASTQADLLPLSARTVPSIAASPRETPLFLLTSRSAASAAGSVNTPTAPAHNSPSKRSETAPSGRSAEGKMLHSPHQLNSKMGPPTQTLRSLPEPSPRHAPKTGDSQAAPDCFLTLVPLHQMEAKRQTQVRCTDGLICSSECCLRDPVILCDRERSIVTQLHGCERVDRRAYA